MLGYLILTSCLLLGQNGDASESEIDYPREVRKLMRQLDSAVADERLKAQEALLKLGPDVLPHLPLANSQFTSEVNKTLRDVRNLLQREAAESVIRSTTVTHSGENTLTELMEIISKQTGNKVQDSRPMLGQEVLNPKIKVEFDKTPFWEAIQTIADKGNLSFYPYVEAGTLGFMNREPGQLPMKDRIAIAGPMQIEATQFQLSSDFRRKAAGTCRMQLDVIWEARLTPIVLYYDPSKFEVLDDQGNSLAVEQENSQIEVPITTGEVTQQLILPLKNPPRAAHKIAKFKGELVAVLPGKIETFTFKDLTAKTPIKIAKGGVAVTLNRVFKNNAIWDINIIVEFDKTSGALESHRGWVLENKVMLKDADGKEEDLAGFEETLRSDNAVGVTYSYDVPEGLANYTLTYETPILILKTPYTFELKDLQLP